MALESVWTLASNTLAVESEVVKSFIKKLSWRHKSYEISMDEVEKSYRCSGCSERLEEVAAPRLQLTSCDDVFDGRVAHVAHCGVSGHSLYRRGGVGGNADLQKLQEL